MALKHPFDRLQRHPGAALAPHSREKSARRWRAGLLCRTGLTVDDRHVMTRLTQIPRAGYPNHPTSQYDDTHSDSVTVKEQSSNYKLITQLKILFNIRFIYGDLTHSKPHQPCAVRFTISCCALFLPSIKFCKQGKNGFEMGKSRRKRLAYSTVCCTVFYACLEVFRSEKPTTTRRANGYD